MFKKTLLALTVFGAASSPTWAQQANSDYPTKPIRIVAPSAAGGGFDLVARVLGSKLSEQMGQQFVVENRSGGGTLAGTLAIAKAALTATGNSSAVTYNGVNQTVSGFTVTGLQGTDTAAVLSNVSAAGATGKNAGSYTNTVTAGTL
jgi:tripartite-type tricarboxylate transporter receptor subunit TctC